MPKHYCRRASRFELRAAPKEFLLVQSETEKTVLGC
jgi:hypothetical protein